MKRKRLNIKVFYCGIACLLAGAMRLAAEEPNAESQLPSFPGAQGAGATTPGGRGGDVHVVTRLDDYGADEAPVPGTLRHAVEQDGPRSVVFGIGGTLRLQRPLVVGAPYLTVAGNTAPFPGITVTGYPMKIRADHVILRYLRFRLDVEVMRERFRQGLDSGWDSVNASRCEYVVFDHLSASHSVDETISFSPQVDRVTLSHSISAYSLRSVFHDYYFKRGPNHPLTQTHNLGGLLAYLGKPNRHAVGSSIYNIWAHHDRRMPGLSAGRNNPKNMISHIDIRNSVMYNWKSNAAGIETGDVERSRYHVNLVGNYFKPGPNTPKKKRFDGLTVMGHNRVYLKDNIHDDDVKAGRPTSQQKLVKDRGRRQGGNGRFLAQPLPTPPVDSINAPSLKALVNDSAGAALPCRDSVDALVIRDILSGTGHHPFVDLENDDSPPIPELPTVRHVYASEDDPFPIWWKLRQGLAADARIDPVADANGDGYTNIEAYMHGLPLAGKAIDWTRTENNGNPPASPHTLTWAPAGTPEILRTGWTERASAETVYNRADGLLLMVGSSAASRPVGVRAVAVENADYWTPGGKNDQHLGPDGAQIQAGAAMVLAFPVPQRLAGIRIGKPHPAEFPPTHDPSRIRIQGMLGWPDDWEELTDAVALPPFAGDRRTHDLPIPAEKQKAYAAYRLVFSQTHGDELRIQSVSPILKNKGTEHE